MLGIDDTLLDPNAGRDSCVNELLGVCVKIYGFDSVAVINAVSVMSPVIRRLIFVSVTFDTSSDVKFIVGSVYGCVVGLRSGCVVGLMSGCVVSAFVVVSPVRGCEVCVSVGCMGDCAVILSTGCVVNSAIVCV